jgi:hypothetical protein
MPRKVSGVTALAGVLDGWRKRDFLSGRRLDLYRRASTSTDGGLMSSALSADLAGFEEKRLGEMSGRLPDIKGRGSPPARTETTYPDMRVAEAAVQARANRTVVKFWDQFRRRDTPGKTVPQSAPHEHATPNADNNEEGSRAHGVALQNTSVPDGIVEDFERHRALARATGTVATARVSESHGINGAKSHLNPYAAPVDTERTTPAQESGSPELRREPPTLEEVAAAAATLAAHYSLDSAETHLALRYAAASKEATERALTATPEQAERLSAIKRLRSLALDLYQRLKVVLLLPSVLADERQYLAAGQLNGTFYNIQKLEKQLDEPRTPKDPLIAEASGKARDWLRDHPNPKTPETGRRVGQEAMPASP